MGNKKKKIIAITAASVVIVLAATFVALGLTVWRPKSTDEWLRDFAASLTMPQGQEEQKYEKTITIEQDGQKASTFFQTVEIHIQDGRPVGHLIPNLHLIGTCFGKWRARIGATTVMSSKRPSLKR